MSLANWLNNSLIVEHSPSAKEIAELLRICDRDLEKAKIVELGPGRPHQPYHGFNLLAK